MRVGDLLSPAHLESRLRELLDWHNFLLQHHLQEAPVDFAATLAVWRQGHFLHFNGLTRLVSSLWPFAAMGLLIVLAARRRDEALL